MPDNPVHTLTIHRRLIEVADELVTSAKAMEEKGDAESLSRARARCATAVFLACAALESCANVVASLHYSDPRGRHDAKAAGWPTTAKQQWHGKSTPHKWQDMARLVPEGWFSRALTGLRNDIANAVPSADAFARDGWQGWLARLCRIRDETIVHFKGSLGLPDIEKAYESIDTPFAICYILFAQRLIDALQKGYKEKHGAEIEYVARPS